ncbi:MAG TPA: proline dehydrogenase family protein, partial [Gemmatimonadales bacterium]
AQAAGIFLWIDMEYSSYVDRTLDVYKKVKGEFPNVGLAMQAYLYRTEKDLEDLLAVKPTIRLVKGAYAEPPAVAFPKKSDVDANYLKLATRLLVCVKEGKANPPIFGTHDLALVKQLQATAAGLGLDRKSYEVHMLFGIKRDDQRRLAESGTPVKVLISYGSAWFPWYMRRLAERPANVWFVVKSLF